MKNRSIFSLGLLASPFLLLGIVMIQPYSAVAECAAPITISLGAGTTHGQVIVLQRFLAKNPSLYPEGLVTGFYGPATTRAVQRFQIAEGIVGAGTPATTGFGAVGPRTRAALNAQMCGTTAAASANSSSGRATTPVATPSADSAAAKTSVIVIPALNNNSGSTGNSSATSQNSAQGTVQPTPASSFIRIPAVNPTPAPAQSSVSVSSSPTVQTVSVQQSQNVAPVVVVTQPPTATAAAAPTTQTVQVPAPATVAVPSVAVQAPTFSNRIVTSSHRFQQNVAFGGWGPHLGHLLRSSNGSLYFVDDTGNDVNRNAGLSYYKYAAGTWTLVGTNTFFGTVQQNTGSVMRGDLIFTYGIDTENHRVEECYFSTVQVFKACNLITEFPLDTQANYIGAALTPSGFTIVWWADIRDNSGGTFEYIYNFGGGWNGPVKSGIAGFNDASYINIAFYDDNNFVMHPQLVTGAAPNWRFVGAFAVGTLGSPITSWNTLSPVGGSDQIISTNDIWVDGQGGTHLLARSQAGALAYYYRPKGGSFSGVLSSISNVYRARFVKSSDGNLYVVYGKNGDGLRVITIPLSSISGALTLSESNSEKISTPSGYSQVNAIYPESTIYQTTPVVGLNVAINGNVREGEIVHIERQ